MVAKAAPDIPLMLYNIPGRTGCNLLPHTVKKLMKCSNIVSIKAASGRIEEVTELRAICGSEFAIYSGDDSLLLPMLSVGGCWCRECCKPYRWSAVERNDFIFSKWARLKSACNS